MIMTKVLLICPQLQTEPFAAFSVVHYMLHVFVSVTLLDYTSLHSNNTLLLYNSPSTFSERNVFCILSKEHNTCQ